MGKGRQDEVDGAGHLRNGGFDYNVDSKDLALVNLLREDARRSYAELGLSVGLSADAVRIRLDRLVSAGYIRFVTLVDPALVGKLTRVSIGVTTSGPPELFASWAQEQAEVIHLVRTLGSFTFFGEFVSANDLEAHRFVCEKLQSAPGVVSAECWPMLRVEKWREDTRSPSVDRSVLEQVSWSDDDRELLRELSASPRIQFRELAERLDRPYGVVRRRAMTLLSAGVVRSTIVTNELLVDHSHLAILLVKGDQRAKSLLLAQPAVTIMSSSTGSRQFVGEVRAESRAGLAALEQELRNPDSGVADVELLIQVAVDKLPASFKF
ncbi:Lrp/AsnC family transcriptional regulator [Pseudomonas sp. NFX224]|uniref:Lrp/AsnC family transcriptional regulator n=1 Tax=Pseudomonas sp. NFX224 TaxID=3402862 RepID=UPI003AFB0C03